MINIKDIYWAAGLLDGEGCFTTVKKYEYPAVICSMSDKEPIERLQKLFGGCLYLKTFVNGNKQLYRWEVTGARAAGLMMTLWSQLCPRRQARISEILKAWKARKKYKTANCRKGHLWTEESTTYGVTYRKGKKIIHRLCRICAEARGDLSRARKIGDANLQTIVKEFI